MRYFSLLLLFFFLSCRKDHPPVPVQEEVLLGNTGNVLVMNEGNYMFGNAKVTYYSKSNGSTVTDLFESTNGFSIGDVLQSAKLHNGKIYFVVNNSGKIVVCDPLNLEQLQTISGLTSPRYFYPVSNSKAYVSDLYANKIWVVDLVNNVVSSSIACNGWTEQMHEMYGEVFVTNYESGKLYVIDEALDVITDSIALTEGASGIVEDKFGKLWVMCSGNSTTSVPAALYKINPITKAIEGTIALSGSPSKIAINPDGDVLYYLNNGVYSLSISSAVESSSPFIPQGSALFYGLGVDPSNGDIYVSDAIDYIQHGKVYIYGSNGTYLRQFNAGIIPGDFLFR